MKRCEFCNNEFEGAMEIIYCSTDCEQQDPQSFTKQKEWLIELDELQQGWQEKDAIEEDQKSTANRVFMGILYTMAIVGLAVVIDEVFFSGQLGVLKGLVVLMNILEFLNGIPFL